MSTDILQREDARTYGEYVISQAVALLRTSGSASVACIVGVNIPVVPLDLTKLAAEMQADPTGGYYEELAGGWVTWGSACGDSNLVGGHLDIRRSLGQVHIYRDSDTQYYMTGYADDANYWQALRLLTGLAWKKTVRTSDVTRAREEVSRVCRDASKAGKRPAFSADLCARALLPDLVATEAIDATHT